MLVNLTRKQKALLHIAKEHGYLTQGIAAKVYVSKRGCQDALRFLVKNDLLKIKGGSFGIYGLTTLGRKMLKN